MRGRSEVRTETQLPCELWIAGDRHPGTALNLSESGLFARTGCRPELGSEVQAWIEASGATSQIALLATVAHHRPATPRSERRFQPGIGLHIERPPDAYHEMLAELRRDRDSAMHQPSIRGAVLQPALDCVRRFVRERSDARQWVSLGLEPEDVGHLAESVSPEAWYPLGSLERLLEVLLTHRCDGDATALTALCRELGNELVASPACARWLAGARAAGDAAGTRLAEAAERGILAGATWRFEGRTADDLRVVVNGLADPGETVRAAIEAALALVFSNLSDGPIAVRSIRMGPETVLYRGTPAAAPGAA